MTVDKDTAARWAREDEGLFETCGPYEKWTLPNGSVVFYRDSDHAYFTEVRRVGNKWTAVNDSRLPSPSTIAKYADPNPDKLMDWAARLGLDWREKRNQAGTTGTSIHEAVERGLHGEPVPLRDVDPNEHGHLIALDRFFNDHRRYLTLLQAEQVVYSQEHRYAGRFDARVVEIVGDGAQTWLLDLKTSKYIGKSYHCQLAGYNLAARECGIGNSDRLLILQTRVEGTYELVPVQADEDDFLAALNIYKRSKALGQRMKAAA